MIGRRRLADRDGEHPFEIAGVLTWVGVHDVEEVAWVGVILLQRIEHLLNPPLRLARAFSETDRNALQPDGEIIPQPSVPLLCLSRRRLPILALDLGLCCVD